METVKEIQTANQLLEQEAAQVKSWVGEYWEGKHQVPKDFNWHGLAEVAASNFFRHDDLTWAEISVGIYDRLHNQSPALNFDGSAMNLRAASRCFFDLRILRSCLC